MRLPFPLLSVLGGLAVLAGACGCSDEGESPRQTFDSDVDQCRANLKSIYDGLRAWQDETGNSPEESGVRFFGQLIASGFWEDTEEMRRTLTCPGANVPLVENMPSFADLEAITGDHSAYAGRDNANHPLPRFPTSGEEPLIACDNAHGMNHAGVLNVLYADGSIKSFRLDQERERGTIGPEFAADGVIFIGENSQIEDLRKLTLN